MPGFVAFGSLFLSLTQCVLALSLLWIYLPPRGRQMLEVTSIYWPIALVFAAAKGALFAWGAAFGEAPVLTLGNICNVANCLFMWLTAIEWSRSVSRRQVWSWLALLAVVGIAFDQWRQAGAATFTLRLYVMSSLLTLLSGALAIELWRIDRLKRSNQIRLALLFAVLISAANLFRIVATAWFDTGSTSNLFNEPPFLFAARILVLVSLILLPLALHNAFFDRLLQQEQEARDHHQRLFDTMPAAGVIWDSSGQITRWNKEAERLFGWEAGRVHGRDVIDLLFGPEQAVQAREFFLVQRLRTRAEDRRATLETVTHQGKTLECEWICRRIDSPTSSSPLTLAVASDVSEIRERERQAEQDRHKALNRELVLTNRLVRVQGDLRDLRSDLTVAAEAARIGIWVEQIGGGFTMSLRCGEIFGLSAGRARTYDELIERFHPEDRRRMLYLHEELSESGRVVWEARVLRDPADQSPGWVSIWAQGERTTTGRLQRVRALVLDITERRQAEQELALRRREVAHLARVNTMGELAGGIAHELNQPLTAILGNAEAGLRLIQSKQVASGDLQDILQDIIDQDRRATEVIRRLRRLVATGEVRSDPIALRALVESTMALVRTDVESLRVAVNVVCTDPLVVVGDEVQLQQVLLNLVVNALDAMKETQPSDRFLGIEVSPRSDESLRIAIRDTGSGIPAERLQKVFEPFFSSKQGGMGLGLSICRTIIEAHGGRITAEQNPTGKGSCLLIELPACAVAA